MGGTPNPAGTRPVLPSPSIPSAPAQPDWYGQVQAQTASPSVPSPELGATADQVREFGGLGASAAEVRAHALPEANRAAAASDLRNLIANPSAPPARAPMPSPAPPYGAAPPAQTAAAPAPAPAPGRVGAAPSTGGQEAPYIEIPGVGPIHLMDLDPADRAQILPQTKARVDFLSSYMPADDEEAQAIRQALQNLPPVIRTANDLAKAGQFLADTSRFIPGESIAAQRLRAAKEAVEAKAKAAAEAAAAKVAEKEATRKAREKQEADKETERKQGRKVTYYQRLAAQASGWAKLDPASQKQMFTELARAARDAGVDMKTVPSPFTLKAEAQKAAATSAKEAKGARQEFNSLLSRVTSPSFLKTPPEARPLLLQQLQDSADRAGVKIPPGVLKTYRTAQLVDSRKKVGDKLTDAEKQVWATSQRVLMAMTKTASGSTKPRYTDIARSRALGVMQGLLKRHNLDPGLLDPSIAGGLKVTPADIGSAPASAPAPEPRAVPSPSSSRPAPRAAALEPSTPRVAPEVEALVRGLVNSHQFESTMGKPEYQDPERRRLLKRAFQQVTGKRWGRK
jgi:hypothetical protein